jgi:hypothetical protein
MKRRCPLLAMAWLAACGGASGSAGDGGTTDYAAAFVGAWTGSATITAGTQTVTQQAKVPIEEVSGNLIRLHGFCSDTDAYADGPLADVTSQGLSFRVGSCNWSSSACNSGNLVLQTSGGSGSLTNGALTVALSGTISCGSQSVDYSLNFASSQKGTYGSLTAGKDEPALAKGLSRALQ